MALEIFIAHTFLVLLNLGMDFLEEGADLALQKNPSLTPPTLLRMTESPRIKCAVPRSWQTALENLAQQTGQTVEQLIYQAIAQYLDKAHLSKTHLSKAHLEKIQDLGTANPLVSRQIQNQLQRIESQVAKVDIAVLQTAMLATRLVAIEQAIGRLLQPQSMLQENYTPQEDLGSRSNLYAEEDVEDEPDEILVSFLESDDFQERLHRAIDFTVPLAFVPSHTDEVYEDESGEILYDFIEP